MFKPGTKLWLSLALIALTALAYAHVCGNDFIHLDDPAGIKDNAHVTQGLNAPNVAWAFSTFLLGNWIPLNWLSLQLDATLFGASSAWGFHLASLLWHGANVVLLFLVLHDMTAAPGRSFMVAALFAVHPLHVESVAWVTERKDLLCAFFWILTMAAYHVYARRPTLGRYGVVMLCFCLALLSKPMAVTLPCVLLLLDAWPLRRLERISFRAAVVEKLPLLAVAGAFSAVTILAQQNAVSSLENLSMTERLQNALAAYGAYLAQTVWPMNLAVFYPRQTVPLALLLANAMILSAATSLLLKLARTRPELLVGWLWFLGTLVPVIGLVQVGDQARADRYTYLPHIGLFITLVWGGAELLARSAALRAAVSALVLLGLSALTWTQVCLWQNSLTLFSHALEVTRDNYLAHTNLGIFFLQRGDFERARHHFILSVRLNPTDADVHQRLAFIALQEQRPFDAIAHCELALRLDPRHAEAHHNLGIALFETGQLEAGVRHLEKYLELAVPRPGIYFHLGKACIQLGQLDKAEHYLNAALADDPEGPLVHLHLGLLALKREHWPQAREHFVRSVQFDPRLAEGHLLLAWVDASRGQWWQAVPSLLQAGRASVQRAFALTDPDFRGRLWDCLLRQKCTR